jgi:hypothetical protein
MDDGEMLETLAGQAPPVRPGWAEHVFHIARRARRRRKVASLAAAAGAALGIGAVSLAVLASPATHPARMALTPSARAADPFAGPYAASITALARHMRGGQAGRWPVIYILDHTCVNVVGNPVAPAGACRPRPLGGKLRRDLAQALQPYAPVAFVADPFSVIMRDLTVIHGGVLIILGPVRLDGAHAQVPVSIHHAGDGGQGLTYRLADRNGRWTIIGTTGTMWIS